MISDLYLRAAEGWIELGNYDEASEELHSCPPAIKSTVECLKLWVRIYAAQNHWREVEMICETLAKHAPEDPFTIFNQAEAFFKQGRPREAYAVFKYSPLCFRKGPKYFYALARYLCALDQKTLALKCLGNAFDKDPSLKLKALDDPDLESIWVDVQEG